MKNVVGFVLYEGPSLLNDDRVVVIATIDRNPKTGLMLMVWILVADVPPVAAAYDGRDEAICGDCVFRALIDAPRKPRELPPRMCYVRLDNRTIGKHKPADEELSPQEIYHAWKAGKFWDPVNLAFAPDSVSREWKVEWGEVKPKLIYIGERPIRLGAYGDPAAVPTKIWRTLLLVADQWTGYTHQWQNPEVDPELKRYCMASVDTPWQWHRSIELGWRPFLVVPKDKVEFWKETLAAERGGILCPMTAGKKNAKGEVVTCANCILCKGMSSNCSKGIWEVAHGPYMDTGLHSWDGEPQPPKS